MSFVAAMTKTGNRGGVWNGMFMSEVTKAS